jgi:hypothetical protein
MNVLLVLDCLDFSKTNVEYYSHDKTTLEHLRGKIKSLRNVHFLADKVAGHHIFRLANATTRIYISHELKSKIERNNFSGVLFLEY